MENQNTFILNFLKDIAANNNRDWMAANKPRYEMAKALFASETAELIGGISDFAPEVGHLQPKDCIFRFNRDTRFSKDKAPYKRHFGTVIAPNGGRKSKLGCYYLHLQPGNQSMVGIGIYGPEPEDLKRLRLLINNNSEEFIDIINQPEFKNTFGNLDVFDTLIRVPAGFAKESPVAEYLKFKHYIASKTFSDKEICASDFTEKILELCETGTPLNRFLNMAFE